LTIDRWQAFFGSRALEAIVGNLLRQPTALAAPAVRTGFVALLQVLLVAPYSCR